MTHDPKPRLARPWSPAANESEAGTMRVPVLDQAERDVEESEYEYLDYDPTTVYVVSGPIPGLQMLGIRGTPRTKHEAERWARTKFGDRLIRMKTDHPWMWAAVVRRPFP